MVVVAVLSACATMNPEQEARTKALQAEILTLHDKLRERDSTFYVDAFSLLEKIRLLTSHPGWTDMAAIITAYSSRLYVEGTEAAQQKRTSELASWTRKWDAAGEGVYARYLSLTQESLNLEYTRISLLAEWEEIHSKMRSLILATMSNANTVADAKMIAYASDINEKTNENTKARLNYYRIGPLGLYEKIG